MKSLTSRGWPIISKVDISWIDKQITNKAIPFFKAGKYTRFKKSHIDRWLETRKVDPIPE